MIRGVRVLVVAMIAAIFLFGCAGAGSGGGDDGGSPGGGSGDAFTADVTEDVTATVTGSGYFECNDVNGGEYNVSASFSLSNNILLSFPDEVTTGFYVLESESEISPDPTAYTAAYYDDASTAFEDNVTGSVDLTSVPTGAGDRFAGTFNFAADDDTARTVTVSGEFDFVISTWTCN